MFRFKFHALVSPTHRHALLVFDLLPLELTWRDWLCHPANYLSMCSQPQTCSVGVNIGFSEICSSMETHSAWQQVRGLPAYGGRRSTPGQGSPDPRWSFYPGERVQLRGVPDDQQEQPEGAEGIIIKWNRIFRRWHVKLTASSAVVLAGTTVNLQPRSANMRKILLFTPKS